MSIKHSLKDSHSPWMDGQGQESDIIISSRIRIARNLAKLPFPHLLSFEQADQVISSVGDAIRKNIPPGKTGDFELIRMTDLPSVERQVLVEKHLISPDLLDDFQKKAVAVRKDEILSVMINEEDHLRLQCLMAGLNLNEAWNLINLLDNELEAVLDYSFDEHLGYLTACPTNVGTGIRASVMLHLPGLVKINQIKSVLFTINKLGLAVRGLYGEGTEASGNLFQFSNQITLGQTEEDIITNLISVARQLLNQERAAREALFKQRREQMEDRSGRAYGLLKHANLMSSDEVMQLLSDFRLGIDFGFIKDIPANLVSELIVLTKPAFLIKKAGRDLTPFECDLYRMKMIREKLAEVEQA